MGLLTYRGRLLSVNGRLTADPACCCSKCPALNVAHLTVQVGDETFTGSMPYGAVLEDYAGGVLMDPTGIENWHEAGAWESWVGETPETSYYRGFHWLWYNCGDAPSDEDLRTVFNEFIVATMGPQYDNYVQIINEPGVDPRTPAGLLELIPLASADHPGAAQDANVTTRYFDSSFGCPC